MTTDDNAILFPFGARPRFSDIRPEEADAATDAALAQLSAAADAAARARPQWNEMWAPLEEAEEFAARAWAQIEHMHSVSGAEWREAHGRNLPKVAATFARIGQHEGLYQNLRALAQNADSLSPARRKIIRDSLRDFALSGAALPAAAKKEFRKNSERLSALAAKFEENLTDATNDGAVRATDDELGDMPDDIKNAARRTKDGFLFSLLPPSYAAFMRHATARELRMEMYRLYHTRASEYGPAARDNSPLIDEMIRLRGRQAELLGFSDYASLALQTRMADSPAAAAQFLRDMAARAMPHARRELAELRDFAAAELDIDDLRPWDMSFAADRLRRKKFDFSPADARPYLQADNVLQGLFSCARKLFGADLQADDAPKWPAEARYFSLRDKDGARAGGLYLDLFARAAKRGGAWMSEATSRFRRRGVLQHPSAHIVCNFTPPREDVPALVDWDEAQTLFHEFGHALHHLLAEAEDYSASGMNGVEWDAIELPSQFMENFIWDWRVLEPMTARIGDGAPMPRALFAKALAGRRFHAGLRLLRQIEFALFDMSMHSSAPRPFMEVLRETRRETALLDAPEWDRFPCGFSHIFAGGYAAGYYSYLWAEMLSADMFAMFAESGDVLNAELGAKFRREILAAGGTRNAMESFVAARGRAPDAAALLKHYGLS